MSHSKPHCTTARALALVAALLPLATACGTEMSARVREAGELAEGSPVTLAGVRVGEVKAIEVAGGDAPVLVRFAVEGNNEEAIASGACSRAEGGTLVLQAGTDTPVVEGQISACQPGLLDGLRGAGEFLRGAVENIRDGVEEEVRQALPANGQGQDGVEVDLTREAGRRAGEQFRGVAEGVREGLGDDAARQLGRAVGRDAEEFRRGVQEGVDEGTQSP